MKHIEVMKEALDALEDLQKYGVKQSKALLSLRVAVAEAEKESVQEPDWSDSKTLPTELWKNRMYSTSDRLLMADGAVAFEREVNANLRKQLTAPKVPEIDYDALIAESFKTNQRWAQGTNGCVAFKHGAEWFRTVLLEATSHENNT